MNKFTKWEGFRKELNLTVQDEKEISTEIELIEKQIKTKKYN